MLIRPEQMWLVEPEYQAQYDRMVEIGRDEAARTKVAIVAIARNAMPHLRNTLALIDELAGRFRDCCFYVYENDSDDDTASVLDDFSIRQWVTVEHETLARPDYRGFEEERTIALAEYRNRCQSWVDENAGDANYVVVLDLDPHGGFSTDGVLNSIGNICEQMSRENRPLDVGGMASHSLWVQVEGGEVSLAAYDAWAARLSWWDDRRAKMPMGWFHMLMLPVGSDPVPMNSAFGGLAVYRREAFLAPGVHYAGGDCEHVHLHKTMRKAGYQLWLNPGCRYFAVLNRQ